jgi:hypothetical protein
MTMSLVMRIGGQARRVRPAPPNRSANPGGLEREIDERACRFYGLTADEIKLVEGAGE